MDAFFNNLSVTSDTLTLDMPLNLGFDFTFARFWRLKALRQCQSLQVNCLPVRPDWPLTSEHIIEWLCLPNPAQQKRLQLNEHVLQRGAYQLVRDLVEVRSFFDCGLSG